MACKQSITVYTETEEDVQIFHQSVKALTDVIVHDIFSPPVASRIYTYASIAAYETAISDSINKGRTLAGRIVHLDSSPLPETKSVYCIPLSTTLAFLNTGKTLIFSEDKIQEQVDQVLNYYKSKGVDKKTIRNSVEFADKMTRHILEWAKKDNYAQTRSFPKYSIQKDPATWKPTPPAYMDAIEPSWNKIRPFVIDSAQQFQPPFPTKVDMTNKNSPFYLEVMEVYNAVKNSNNEQIEIANFWDCNPYKLNVTGHVMHATKKITPGGHWINIVGVACKMKKEDLQTAAKAYALVSISLADGFISCWDEKYRSNYVRPESIINEYVDQEWMPLLQTPPFPEYTSGHSVISSASAVAMTYLFGDNFAFEDDTEIEFGLPARKFNSFYHASDEAAVSRLYGGIHFRPAIDNGVKQGKALGQYIVEKLKI